jgi:survival-of-motor-neuron-related-splicing factor 30
LETVEDFLQENATNEEYLQIKKDLTEVITLTKDLLKLKVEEFKASRATAIANAPRVAPALTTQPPSATFFSVGTICEAKYSVDGTWYTAKIDEILERGMYRVTYIEYDNQEVVSITDIKPLGDLVKQIRNTPLKRPAVPDAIQQIPKSLQILPTDNEETRMSKKKKVHAIKSQNRLKVLEEERNSVKNNWLKFQTKSKKKVPMTLTGKKKGSIFASPESASGKVGVTNSGKPMTQPTQVVEAKDMLKIVGTKRSVFMPPTDTDNTE